jgi:hypothetical protein
MCFSALAVTTTLAQQKETVSLPHKLADEVVADPYRVNNLPTTMTVKTAALLELHAMRQSAVDLCLQLPTRYQTHLPQCANIFEHEIRLQAFARDEK